MATLRLLSTPAHRDGSHRITAPGGYEFWRFLAEDAERRIGVAVTFHDGFLSHPEYAARYAKYLRHPTRNQPPLPAQYPCLQVRIIEGGSTAIAWTEYFPAGTFAESHGRIALKSNAAEFLETGRMRLRVSAAHYATGAELTFRARMFSTEPAEITFPADRNVWIPAYPLCDVEGRIELRGRMIEFSGVGQHDHCYGTRPVESASRGWVRGNVLLPNGAEMFQIAAERCVAISASGSTLGALENPPMSQQWKSGNFLSPPYPVSLNFGERVILRNPRVQKPPTAQTHLIYDAYVDGEQATGWVEIDRR
jgi:hypothetical protein